MEKKNIDKLVLGSFIGHLVSIFVTDALYFKYRKTSYSQQTRMLLWLRLFFIWLALHAWKEWKYDPVSMIARRLFSD